MPLLALGRSNGAGLADLARPTHFLRNLVALASRVLVILTFPQIGACTYFKSGDCSQVKNYRTISLLCVVSKVLERLMYNHILKFIKSSFTPN